MLNHVGRALRETFVDAHSALCHHVHCRCPGRGSFNRARDTNSNLGETTSRFAWFPGGKAVVHAVGLAIKEYCYLSSP